MQSKKRKILLEPKATNSLLTRIFFFSYLNRYEMTIVSSHKAYKFLIWYNPYSSNREIFRATILQNSRCVICIVRFVNDTHCFEISFEQVMWSYRRDLKNLFTYYLLSTYHYHLFLYKTYNLIPCRYSLNSLQSENFLIILCYSFFDQYSSDMSSLFFHYLLWSMNTHETCITLTLAFYSLIQTTLLLSICSYSI